jgi:hypothetical protein
MYANIFASKLSGDARQRILAYKLNETMIAQYMTQNKIPLESNIIINSFNAKNEDEQRAELEKAGKLNELFRVLFAIVDQVASDKELVRFCLCLINGILEDKRTRIKSIISMQSSATKKVDTVAILFQFLQKCLPDDSDERRLASHTLAMIIQEYEIPNEKPRAEGERD